MDNRMKRTPEEIMIEALLTGDVGSAIENQERRGQSDLANNNVLPIECPRADLERLGFVFGDPVDDLFISVTMPAGWKKKPTDHAMWSDLLDPQGRRRGGIFYKAAFYDRRAGMHLTPRFAVYSTPINGYGENYQRDDPEVIVVTDGGQRIWQSPGLPPIAQYGTPEYETRKQLESEYRTLAETCLTECYPQWRDVCAHWE